MMQLWSKALLAGPVCPYKDGQIIFESSTPGSYNVELLITGKYEVYCIGGGAGAAYVWGGGRHPRAGGGSGAGFIGVVTLAQSSLTCIVGNGGNGLVYNATGRDFYSGPGGNSEIKDCVLSYGAPASYCRANSNSHKHESYGASLPQLSVPIISQTLNVAGNKGTVTGGRGYSVTGGASVYNGYGKGGDSSDQSADSGVSGYVKIIYKGK